MRGWRHDYHNHIQALKAHLALEQYADMGAYLSKLDGDLTSVDTILKTGNTMVDAILNSKSPWPAPRRLRSTPRRSCPTLCRSRRLTCA